MKTKWSAKWVAFAMGFGLLLSAAPATAHHAFAAEYDVNKPFKLTGTVTKVEWTNPHAWFFIDVKDDTGKVTNWGFELVSPNALMRNGWTHNSVKIGDTVTVEGSRSKDGTPNGNVKAVTLASTGQKLFSTLPAEP